MASPLANHLKTIEHRMLFLVHAVDTSTYLGETHHNRALAHFLDSLAMELSEVIEKDGVERKQMGEVLETLAGALIRAEQQPSKARKRKGGA